MPRTLSAQQAAEQLGVSRATLYSYVSRGLIRSEAGNTRSRERRYLAEDVEALTRRREGRRDPGKIAQDALHWGAPLLQSALTLIRDGQLYYRGFDATSLARDAQVEDVAALLWTGQLTLAPQLPLRARLNLAPAWPSETPVEAYAHALTYAAAHDPRVLDTRRDHLPGAAARVLTLLYAETERHAGQTPAPDLPLHARLARAWAPREPHAASLLRAALILTADHELNASSFTARCAASTGANLAHAVLAGLCALQGPRHGRASEAALGLLRDAQERGERAALTGALQHARTLPGFGHRLYPDGDPRGAQLVTLSGAAYPDHPAVHAARSLAALVQEELGEYPTVDFGLALVARVLGFTSAQVLALFALGRSAGWLAHAIEAASDGQLLRPRATYVGPQPDTRA